jgi:polyhydroxybutyrate depolymerase
MRKVSVCGITPRMTEHGARLGLVLTMSCLVAACGTASPEAGVPHDANHDGGIDVAVGAGPDAPSGDASPDAATNDVGVDAPAPDAGSSTCGTRTGMRGLTHRSVKVGSATRTYLIYLPTTLSATTAVPFVYAFHGFTESGQDMYNMTNYSALADSEGFAVAFPDGEGGAGSDLPPWNVKDKGQTVCGAGEFASAGGDDFGFMDAMRTDVENDQCIDSSHVFTVGFSMGGYFTHHVGCYRSDIHGIAPHSGGTLADLSVCTTGNMPTIIFHGTSDPVIEDACDNPTVTPLPKFPASANLWAAKNGCQSTYTTIAENGTSGSDGQCYIYDGCPADGQVEVCTFNGMGHCWAGGTASGCTDYASATQLQWDFFKTYAW